MGGVVSAGTNNSELVDNLVYADILKTPEIEKVFRAVDRGVYYLPDHREGAYKDRAWKHKNLHLSAPCIYGEVMEALELKKGMSFLNLGSGTGYLSTMAGLILGPQGTNHGVEIHRDVVDYSEEQLKEYISANEFFDAFEFCMPVFHCGNCLNLSPTTASYDRVYCGAACSSKNEDYMKSLVNVGGLLVMPLGDELVKVRRVSETEWESKGIMAVSFADLVPTSDDGKQTVELTETTALSLQEACRIVIRGVLRKNVEDENPGTELFALRCNQKKKRKQKKSQNSQERCRVPPPETSRHPYIRVSFLPSGGRFMFVRSFSDNEEDSESNYEGERYSGDGHDAAEVHVEGDGERAGDPDRRSAFRSDDSTARSRDVPIETDADGRNLPGTFGGPQNNSNQSSSGRKAIWSEIPGRNPTQKERAPLSTLDEQIENFLECKPQSCKKLRTNSLQDAGKPGEMDASSSPEQQPNGRNSFSYGEASRDGVDCDSECPGGSSTGDKFFLNENEISLEKTKTQAGQSTACEVRGHLMSVSSGIGTHESMETDDEAGFDSSSCDQQDIRTNSSLSSSSPSSMSLSSPPRSTSGHLVNPNDLPRPSLSALQSNDEQSRKELAPEIEEEDSDCDNNALEPEVEILNYKYHMKNKIASLPIPFMLKKFLMYDRA